jgi:hypothetical protein
MMKLQAQISNFQCIFGSVLYTPPQALISAEHNLPKRWSALISFTQRWSVPLSADQFHSALISAEHNFPHCWSALISSDQRWAGLSSFTQ